MFNHKSKGVTTMGRLADKNILITVATAGSGWPRRRIRQRGRARRHLRLEQGVAAGG